MKKLACKDIDPSSDCHYVAEGSSDDEVIGKMIEHAQKAHPEKVAEMNMPENEMKEMMKSKITS